MRDMLKGVLVAFTLAALSLGAAPAARADASACDDTWGASSGIHMRRVTYLGPFSGSTTDLRADFLDVDHKVQLRGWLYFAEDKLIKNDRVLIYDHGHEEVRTEPCAIAKYFVRRGFVVFAPLRRGHRGKEGSEIRSTGVHTDDYVNYCQIDGCNDPRCSAADCSTNALQVSYMRDQRADVQDQLDYILAHAAINKDGDPAGGKLANPHQVAILGHSFGGSLIVFANAQVSKHNVAIDISGAELSWGIDEPYWQISLSGSMANQKRPIYFLQPKNGRTLAPTKTLFGLAIDEKYRSQAAIFPPVPTDPSDPDPEFLQAHGAFITSRDQVELWGPSVIDFIKRHPLP